MEEKTIHFWQVILLLGQFKSSTLERYLEKFRQIVGTVKEAKSLIFRETDAMIDSFPLS